MHREIQATHPAGSKWLFGALFFLIPSLLAFAWVSALSRNASPASALWFLYEVSRLLAYIGIIIATGLTLGIAIRRLMLGSEAGEVVCLLTPREFRAVGEFYADFPQLADEDVCRLLLHDREESAPSR